MSNDTDDMIMPEGFEEGKDIFEMGDEEEAPTTETETDVIENVDEVDEAFAAEEEAPTEEPEPEETVQKAKIKVKYNHEERELDEDEAAPLIQKGMNYDKVLLKAQELEDKLGKSERLAKLMGFKSTDEMVDAAEKNYVEKQVEELVNDGLHEAVARDLVEREVEKKRSAITPQVQVDPAKDKLDKELDEFVRLNPNVTKLPEEVIAAVKTGTSLPVAYERFKNKQAQDELKILKQNQSAAAKAPVAAVTKHGSTKQKAKDAFEIGFDSDDW